MSVNMGDVCQQASLLHICCHTNHPYILRVTIYMLHIDIDKLRVDINIVWFIYCSLFSDSLEDMSLVCGRKCVTYIGEGLLLGAYGLWSWRDLYRAIPAMTLDLESHGLIRKTANFSRLYNKQGTQLTTYFNPDPLGIYHKY